MDALLNSGLQIIQWFQSLGSWLTPPMQLFTFLGSVQFYLMVVPIILWCVDPGFGIRLGLFLMTCETLVSALKIALHGPRPYWYSHDIKVLGAAESNFGAPSGHAQDGVVVWGTLAARIKSRPAWIIALVIIFLIGLSRIYLAVHFPHDVLLGWILGAVVLWLLFKLEKPVVSWVKQLRIGMQLLVSFLFSLFLILLVVIAHIILNGWNLPELWVNNAHLAFPAEPAINPLSYHNSLTGPGAFFGLAAGWIWISTLGGFTTHDLWWKLVLRYILGVIGLLILYIGLGSLYPDVDTGLSYAWHYIRYVLIGLWVSGFAPWLFIKLKIASPLK